VSLARDGLSWRYQLESGGIRETPLDDQAFEARALDDRLRRRLASTSVDEFRLTTRLLTVALEAKVSREEVALRWRASDKQALVGYGADLIGISPIGEYVTLISGSNALPLDLCQRVVRWGCGRIAPAWEPVQVSILPAVGTMESQAAELGCDPSLDGIRVEVRNENTLGKRLRACWLRQIPWMIVIAPKEFSSGLVELRQRGCREGTMLTLDSVGETIRQSMVDS
jgi:hypothetical protein